MTPGARSTSSKPLHTLDEKWKAIIKNTEDVDIKADYGNDSLQLRILEEEFEEAAVEEFGLQIKETSRIPFTVSLNIPPV